MSTFKAFTYQGDNARLEDWLNDLSEKGKYAVKINQTIVSPLHGALIIAVRWIPSKYPLMQQGPIRLVESQPDEYEEPSIEAGD